MSSIFQQANFADLGQMNSPKVVYASQTKYLCLQSEVFTYSGIPFISYLLIACYMANISLLQQGAY